MRQTFRKWYPGEQERTVAPTSPQITLCCRLLHGAANTCSPILPDHRIIKPEAYAAPSPPLTAEQGGKVRERASAKRRSSSPGAAETRGCRADRLPCSNSGDRPVRAVPAGVGSWAGRRTLRAGQLDAAEAQAGSPGRGPPRSPVRSGSARALWVSGPPPCRLREERQTESAALDVPLRDQPALGNERTAAHRRALRRLRCLRQRLV